MKLGIMQPYFFPYLGYFQLLTAVDRWIVFDDTQFVHRGWVNRNRVLHPNPEKEWQYLTVPLAKKSREEKICNLHIQDERDWRAELLGKLSAYRKAPHYHSTLELVRKCLDVSETALTPLLVRSLRGVARHLGFEPRIEVQSEITLEPISVDHPGQWALRLCEQLGAACYINPVGGAAIFRQDEFDAAGSELLFL